MRSFVVTASVLADGSSCCCLMASSVAESSCCCFGGDWMATAEDVVLVLVESSSGERTPSRCRCNPCHSRTNSVSLRSGTNVPGKCRTPSSQHHYVNL